MTIPSHRRLHNTAFVLVVPLYAIQHEWMAGEESVGQVGGACGVWLITRGRVIVETPRGTWNLETGSAFVFMLPGERRVFTPEGASWLSVGLRATAYETFDLAASLPLPAVWKPGNEEWNALRSCAETLAHSWEAPHFSTVDSRTYSGYISRQRSVDLERDASTALLVEGMARALFALCWRKHGEPPIEYIRPSYGPWREFYAETIHKLVNHFELDAFFLDQLGGSADSEAEIVPQEAVHSRSWRQANLSGQSHGCSAGFDGAGPAAVAYIGTEKLSSVTPGNRMRMLWM